MENLPGPYFFSLWDSVATYDSMVPSLTARWLRQRSYENVVPSEDPGMVADGARMSFAREAPRDGWMAHPLLWPQDSG